MWIASTNFHPTLCMLFLRNFYNFCVHNMIKYLAWQLHFILYLFKLYRYMLIRFYHIYFTHMDQLVIYGVESQDLSSDLFKSKLKLLGLVRYNFV